LWLFYCFFENGKMFTFPEKNSCLSRQIQFERRSEFSKEFGVCMNYFQNKAGKFCKNNCSAPKQWEKEK